METDTSFMLDQMPRWMIFVLAWLKNQPILTALFISMALDVFTGVAKAFAQKKINSSVSWIGGCKKVIILILIGLAAVFEPFSGGIPLTKISALFFLYHEGLSILENAVNLGVPVPQALKDALQKGVDKNTMPTTTTTTTTTTGGAGATTVTTSPAANVEVVKHPDQPPLA